MRDNTEKKPAMKDFASLRLHPSFPGQKTPMDTDNHPDRHVPMAEHRHGTPLGIESPEIGKQGQPKPTKTDSNKKMPKIPFRGANS